MSTPGKSLEWEVVALRDESVLALGPWRIIVRKMDTAPSVRWWEWVDEKSDLRMQGFKSHTAARKGAEQYLRAVIAELAEALS